MTTLTFPTTNPTPEHIKAARKAASLTQTQAAEKMGLGSPQRWSEIENGHVSPDPARWMLFLLLTDQHPELVVKERA